MWHIQNIHSFNASHWRAAAQRLFQPVKCSRRTFRGDLHAPVREIPRVPSQIESLGLPAYEPPEPDPLHPAPHAPTPDHGAP